MGKTSVTAIKLNDYAKSLRDFQKAYKEYAEIEGEDVDKFKKLQQLAFRATQANRGIVEDYLMGAQSNQHFDPQLTYLLLIDIPQSIKQE